MKKIFIITAIISVVVLFNAYTADIKDNINNRTTAYEQVLNDI